MISVLSTLRLVQRWCYLISATSRIYLRTPVYHLHPPTLFPPSVLKLRCVSNSMVFKDVDLGNLSCFRAEIQDEVTSVWCKIKTSTILTTCVESVYRRETCGGKCNWTCNHCDFIVTVPQLNHTRPHPVSVIWALLISIHTLSKHFLLCVKTPMYISHLLWELYWL